MKKNIIEQVEAVKQELCLGSCNWGQFGKLAASLLGVGLAAAAIVGATALVSTMVNDHKLIHSLNEDAVTHYQLKEVSELLSETRADSHNFDLRISSLEPKKTNQLHETESGNGWIIYTNDVGVTTHSTYMINYRQ